MTTNEDVPAIAWVIGAAVLLALLSFVACSIWQTEYRQARDAALVDSAQENMQKAINEAKLGVPYSGWDEADAPPAPLPARSPAVSAGLVALVTTIVGLLTVIALQSSARR